MLIEHSKLINDWNQQGLPNDELSVQNAVISTKANKYPLFIDPQIQGKTWIKNLEKNNLVVTKMYSDSFRQILEDSLSNGKSLLIEDIGEDLDPILFNVLSKNYIKVGTSLKVSL
jgi:dynein heavy chain